MIKTLLLTIALSTILYAECTTGYLLKVEYQPGGFVGLYRFPYGTMQIYSRGYPAYSVGVDFFTGMRCR